MRSFEDLVVYRRGYELALKSYQLTSTFPSSERYELGHQLRTAAVSMLAKDTVEGIPKEFKHFLRNALGSTNEMMVLLKLSKDLVTRKMKVSIAEYDDFREATVQA